MINRDANAPAWRTSSQNNAACVEVKFDGDTVFLRDTKDKERGPEFQLTRDQWNTFAFETMNELPSNNGAVDVTVGELVAQYDDGLREELTRWHVRSLTTAEMLHFREDEWQSFREGVAEGTFGDIPTSAEPLAS